MLINKSCMMMAAAALMSLTAPAQQNDSANATLDDVTITANRIEQKQSTTGKVITVISKDKIEKSAGKTVTQLLNEQVGINVIGSLNNAGSVQTVYMRGAASGRTLILMDGIPVNDPSMINNEFDLNLVSLNDVERIEISRGAQSTVYGSDAVAGAINIITEKKQVQKPFNATATLAAGNYGSFKENLQLYGKVKGLSYTARYARLDSKGFSAAYDSTGKQGFDKDGYHGDVANASLRYDFNKQLSAKTYLQYSRYTSDVDRAMYTDDKDWQIKNKGLASGASLEYKTEKIAVTANYRYSDVGRNYLNDSTDQPGTMNRDEYFGKTQFVEIYSNIRLHKNLTLLAGADHRFNGMNQNNFGTYPASPWGPAGSYSSHLDSAMHQESIYASLLFHALKQRLNIELGGRYNNHSVYGSNSTFTFNPSYRLTEKTRIFGSIASSFKAPTLYQISTISDGSTLEPETSVNYEAGIQYGDKKFNTRLVYFYRDVKDGLDYDYNKYQYFNFNHQIVSGLELEASAFITDKIRISANYSYLSAKETTQSRQNFKDTTYDYALRRPEHLLNMDAGYQPTAKLYVNIGGKYAGERHDIGSSYMAEDVKLDSYFILNGYAEYKFMESLKLFVNLQNITNKKFFDLAGYNSIPFMFTAGATFHL